MAATSVVLPLVVSVTGKDSFRLPKLLLLTTSSIALATVAVCAVVLGVHVGRGTRWPHPLLFIIGAAVVWSTFTTLTSSNLAVSTMSLLIVLVAAMFFVASYNGVQDRSLTVLYLALAPAVVNAFVAIGQRMSAVNPLTSSTDKVILLGGESTVAAQAALQERMHTTALLGNPDEVGMFLVAPTLAAAVLAVVSPKHRLPAGLTVAVLIAAMFASETLGAIAALVVGFFVLAYLVRPRIAVTVALIALLAGGAVARMSPHRWLSTRTKLAAAARGDVDQLLSGRMPAFYAAWRMFRQHPIAGVGLGCFPYEYFDAKISVARDHPAFADRAIANFEEAHNEHLQILAEGGIPSYVIFIAALVLLARRSIQNGGASDDVRAMFASRLALPLAAAFAVLALSSFPLRLAAPTASTFFLSALVFAWSADAGV